MTLDEMIFVLQAAKAGKTIEYRVRVEHSAWTIFSVRTPTAWNFDRYEYRVKPEPRRVWVNEHRGDLVGNTWYEMLSDAEKYGSSSGRQIEFVEVLK